MFQKGIGNLLPFIQQHPLLPLLVMRYHAGLRMHVFDKPHFIMEQRCSERKTSGGFKFQEVWFVVSCHFNIILCIFLVSLIYQQSPDALFQSCFCQWVAICRSIHHTWPETWPNFFLADSWSDVRYIQVVIWIRITKNFRYLKWRVSKSPYLRLFWGWGNFPYP